MIAYRCPIPECREEQTMPITGVFRVAKRTVCIKCGAPILVAVLAVTEDKAKELLRRRTR